MDADTDTYVTEQVGYVFLVSAALEPLSCKVDINKKRHMLAHPQQECNWCETGSWHDLQDTGSTVPYPVLAGVSLFAASLYGIGIPTLFFYIMYKHRDEIKEHTFVRKYGFLTSKTSERYYWWEVAIITRKLMVSLITKGIIIENSSERPDSAIRMALCNMVVLVIACMAQAHASPFAHTDANVAETGLLVCSILLLLVGMGTREVRDTTTHAIIRDTGAMEAPLSREESGWFYWIIYIFMGATIVGVLLIIARRIGSVRHQFKMGRERKLVWNDDDDDDDEGALPIEIANLINKNRLEAANAWFNEKENDSYRRESRHKRMLYSLRRCCRRDHARDAEVSEFDVTTDSDSDLMKYRVVSTHFFVPQVPFPGQVSQLKTRLRRKLGVLRVCIDEENCTIVVHHDLSQSSGPRSTAEELLRVVNLIIPGSRIHRACADEPTDLTSWISGLWPICVGGVLVLLHQLAVQVDCHRAETTPMNCSSFKETFDFPNSNLTNSSELPSHWWENVDHGGVLPAPEYMPYGKKQNQTLNDVIKTETFDNGRKITEEWCYQTQPPDADTNAVTGITSHELVHGTTTFLANCSKLGSVNRDDDSWFGLDKFKPFPYFERFVQYQKTAKRGQFSCGRFTPCALLTNQVLDNRVPFGPSVQAAAECAVCNFQYDVFLYLALMTCFIPIVKTLSTLLYRRWKLRSWEAEQQLQHVHEVQAEFLDGVLSAAAMTLSLAIGDHEGAAAVAVLFGLTHLYARRPREEATIAIYAAIARISQNSDGRKTLRATVAGGSVGADDEAQIEGLVQVIKRAAKPDDSTSFCGRGIRMSSLEMCCAVYTITSVLVALCIIIASWTVTMAPASREVQQKVAVMLLVTACPRAILVAKPLPFWCSVATSARDGFLSEAHIKLIKQGTSISDETVSEKTVSISKTCKRKTRQNILCALLGKVCMLLALLVIVCIGLLRERPWRAMLVELVTMVCVSLNSKSIMGLRITVRCQRRCYRCLQHRRWEKEAMNTRDDEVEGYKTKLEEVERLLKCIEEYNKFCVTTGLKSEQGGRIQRSRFSDQFTEDEISSLHLWLGAMGRVPSDWQRSKEEWFESQLKPLFEFLVDLDTQERQQLLANIPSVVKAAALHCTSMKAFQAREAFLPMTKTGEDKDGFEMRETFLRDQTDQAEQNGDSGARDKKWWQQCTCVRLWQLMQPVLLSKRAVIIFATCYTVVLCLYIKSKTNYCCKPLILSQGMEGSDLTIEEQFGFNTKLDTDDPDHGCVPLRNTSELSRRGKNDDQIRRQEEAQRNKELRSVLAPGRTCPATCMEGYFPNYVLRRGSEPKTRADSYTCTLNPKAHWWDIFKSQPLYSYWSHSGHLQNPDGIKRPFACDKPIVVTPNSDYILSSIDEGDQQRWFELDVYKGVTYQVTVTV
eukprot:COSAG01_NODE_2933_length_6829_cov_10.437890_2_plen_1407_part_01